jgi:hypothetical protein
MKHWLKCLLLATSIFAPPSSTPSLAVSAPPPLTQTSAPMRGQRELVTSRPTSMSRTEQLLLFSFCLGLVALQLRRKHEILTAPRLPI